MKAIENYLKNILLKLLLILNPHNEKNKGYLNQNENKILFVRLNRIGDALVTTPLLHAVKRNIKAKIYILADRKNYIAYNNNPDIDKLIIFNKGIKGFFEIRHLVKRENINTIVDLHDDVSTTVSFLVALAKAQNKFALEKGNKNIYSKTIKRLDASQFHVVDRLLELAKLFNVKLENANENIHYYPGEESVNKVERFLSDAFSNKKFLLGINISAGSKARFWGTENYKKLIGSLTDFDVNLLLICSPEDLEDAKKISENKSIIFYSENYNEFAAMISELSFLITPDTAAVHLASAFQVPVFGIYVKYNTSEMIWSPYKSDFDCVVTEGPTLKNIEFEEVINKLKPFIEKHIYSSSNVSRQ